jgi:hypothetical protein
MILRYGSDFAQSFLAYALKGTERLGVQEAIWIIEHPSGSRSEATDCERASQGATLDSTVEFWVHPPGTRSTRS